MSPEMALDILLVIAFEMTSGIPLEIALEIGLRIALGISLETASEIALGITLGIPLGITLGITSEMALKITLKTYCKNNFWKLWDPVDVIYPVIYLTNLRNGFEI